MNFFVELNNPHKVDPNLSENGAARLQMVVNPQGAPPSPQPLNSGIYQIQIQSRVETGLAAGGLRDPANVNGTANVQQGQQQFINITCGYFNPDPTQPVIQPPPNGVVAPDNYHYTVQPANGQYSAPVIPGRTGSNVGYYVIGPSKAGGAASWQADFPHDRAGAAPPFRPTLAVDNVAVPAFNGFPGYQNAMHTTLPLNTNLTAIASSPNYRCTVLLRRIANPNVAPSNNPAQRTSTRS